MAFKCSICENDYSSAPALRRHVNEKHENNRFKCDCGMDFSRNLTLKKHLENCKGGSISSLNNIVSDGNQSLDSKFNSDISEDVDMVSNNLSKSSESNGGYITDDSPVPKIFVNNSRKSKITSDSYDEDEILKPSRKRVRVINSFKYCGKDSRKSKILSHSGDEDEILKTPRKRVRILVNSQDGSGSDSKRSNTNTHNYSGKSDIFSKNKNDYSESDSEDNQSEVSDDNESDSAESEICDCRNCRSKSSKKNTKNKYIHSIESENQSEVSDDNESDSVGSEICYCRECRNKPSKKNLKNQYVHSNESDNQSESGDEKEMDMEKEFDVKLETNQYNQYYESQASGGGVFSQIIGNPTRTGNVSGRLSSLYRSSFPIPKILRNAISKSQENDSNYKKVGIVSSYSRY